MSDVTDGFYQASDGLRLFYQDFQSQDDGDLDPVLCLPGLTRNSLDFVDIAMLLSKSRRVISTDLRGRGRSEYDPDRLHYHPGQYVADIWQLLDQLDISKVAVIGTSLGGLMAMLMAHERAAVISAAVMNDIGPDIDAEGLNRLLAGAATSPVVASWDEAVREVKIIYGQAYPNWSESDWQEHTRKTYSGSNGDGFDLRVDRAVGTAARDGLSGLRQDPWKLFAALRPIPLLVVRGEQSDILSAATVQEMRRRKPDLKAVEIPNRGHAPNLNEPEAINAINNFLNHS